jgi:hypothetical protein
MNEKGSLPKNFVLAKIMATKELSERFRLFVSERSVDLKKWYYEKEILKGGRCHEE